MRRALATLAFLAAILFPICAQAAALDLPSSSGDFDVLPFAYAANGTASYNDVREGHTVFVPFAEYKGHGAVRSVWLRFDIRKPRGTAGLSWYLTVPREVDAATVFAGNQPALTT